MVVRKRDGWTAEDDALLREMADAGKGAIAISARLRRRRSAIQTRARALGLKLESVHELRKRLGLTAQGRSLS